MGSIPLTVAILLDAIPALLVSLIFAWLRTEIVAIKQERGYPFYTRWQIFWRTFRWSLLVSFVLLAILLSSVSFSGLHI